MREYRKISNMFAFDAKYREITGLNEPFASLSQLVWIGTEKVDGTNIRVHWDGHRIELAGRTDNAQFQGELKEALDELFMCDEMEYVFEQVFGEKEAFVYGEGYGPKIQAGGGLYAESPKFIVFDVDIDGYHLNRANVQDVAEKLGLDCVPVVFEGTLDEAEEFVKGHKPSTLGGGQHEMEGLVLELPLDLFDRNGERIKCKCKYRDVLKGGRIYG